MYSTKFYDEPAIDIESVIVSHQIFQTLWQRYWTLRRVWLSPNSRSLRSEILSILRLRLTQLNHSQPPLSSNIIVVIEIKVDGVKKITVRQSNRCFHFHFNFIFLCSAICCLLLMTVCRLMTLIEHKDKVQRFFFDNKNHHQDISESSTLWSYARRNTWLTWKTTISTRFTSILLFVHQNTQKYTIKQIQCLLELVRYKSIVHQ